MPNFFCSHCEKCCAEPGTQISVTVGDIWRLSQFLDISIPGLFEKHIAFNPMMQDEDHVYEIVPGLNIPCIFFDREKKENRCDAYEGRPLNCRTFPFWILPLLARRGENDPNTPCLADPKVDDLDEHNRYCEALTNITVKEREITEYLLKKFGMMYTMKIPFKDYKRMKASAKGGHDFSRKKISYCQEKFDQEKVKDFPYLLEIELSKNPLFMEIIRKNSEDIERIEKKFR